MNPNRKTVSPALEAFDTSMLDAPLQDVHHRFAPCVRSRLSLALAASAVLCSCSPPAAGGRRPESAPTARGTPRSAEAAPAEPVTPVRAPEPIAPSQAERAPAAPDTARPLSELLEDARRDVLGLGKANVTDIKERAARVLSALAALVEASDGKRHAADQLAEIEFEAERLRRADGASFAQAGWMRLGLVAALDALPHLAPAPRQAQTPQREAARQAAEAIPERASLAFHHAAIQDAARATVEAFGSLLPGATPCLVPDDRAPESEPRAANADL
jgi:hypothetical protein